MSELMTKERLSEYKELKAEIVSLEEQLLILKSKAQYKAKGESIGSQHQPGAGDWMENAIIRQMEHEERMKTTIERNSREMVEIELAIDALKRPKERRVLRMRYIYGDCEDLTPWNEIAMRIYGTDDENALYRLYALHRRALEHLNQKKEVKK